MMRSREDPRGMEGEAPDGIRGMGGPMEMVARDENLLREAVEVLKDSAMTLGMLLRRSSPIDTLKVAPLTLFPNTVPKADEALDGAASVDPFIRHLFAIYRQINPATSQWELGLIRSDYILCQKNFCQCASECYQQVEVNTICAGLAAVGAMSSMAHQRVLGFLGYTDLAEKCSSLVGDSLALFGEGLRMAYEVYCRETSRPDQEINEQINKPVMLIVIHDGFEFNIADQRLIEFSAGVPSIRRSFREIAKTVRVDDEGRLFVEEREMAVVYYRTGYSPDQYKDGDWDIRLLIEMSRAVKCPSVAHQLAGFKKIQQMLSRRDVLQRFISEEKVISRMQMTFVGQWDISERDSKKRIEDALKEPEKYVLKPNREGGGNNFYGEDLVRKMKEVRDTSHAKEYILMELIQPVLQENFFVRPERSPERVKTISEVGVFGVILAKKDQVLLNKSAKGVLVRSKASDAQEGGVSSGHSCISSVVTV